MFKLYDKAQNDDQQTYGMISVKEEEKGRRQWRPKGQIKSNYLLAMTSSNLRITS